MSVNLMFGIIVLIIFMPEISILLSDILIAKNIEELYKNQADMANCMITIAEKVIELESKIKGEKVGTANKKEKEEKDM